MTSSNQLRPYERRSSGPKIETSRLAWRGKSVARKSVKGWQGPGRLRITYRLAYRGLGRVGESEHSVRFVTRCQSRVCKTEMRRTLAILIRTKRDARVDSRKTKAPTWFGHALFITQKPGARHRGTCRATNYGFLRPAPSVSSSLKRENVLPRREKWCPLRRVRCVISHGP